MANKFCDLCGQEHAVDMRFGVNMCRSCSEGYNKAMSGDPIFVEKFSDPKNFPDATAAAQQNILLFIAKRAGKQEAAQQEVQKQEASDYPRRPSSNDEPFLDSLYENIGNKIKAWAKWIFVLGAIISVIGSIVDIINAEDPGQILAAIFMIFLGPLICWVSSWMVYGFGELIEKVSANESHTRKILKLMAEKKQD